MTPGQFPPIKVFQWGKGGYVHSLDNRRLLAYKMAGIKEIKTEMVSFKYVKQNYQWKLSTDNGGIDVRVTGGL